MLYPPGIAHIANIIPPKQITDMKAIPYQMIERRRPLDVDWFRLSTYPPTASLLPSPISGNVYSDAFTNTLFQDYQ